MTVKFKFSQRHSFGYAAVLYNNNIGYAVGADIIRQHSD